MDTSGGDDDDDGYWKYKSSSSLCCATLEFPVSPALILSPGAWLLVVTNESKQKTNDLFSLQFSSWENSFLNTAWSCYNSVISVLISNQNVSQFLLLLLHTLSIYKT